MIAQMISLKDRKTITMNMPKMTIIMITKIILINTIAFIMMTRR